MAIKDSIIDDIETISLAWIYVMEEMEQNGQNRNNRKTIETNKWNGYFQEDEKE